MNEICLDIGVKQTLVIIGYILVLAKILIPIILIIIGIKNLYNAFIGDEDDIKKTVYKLGTYLLLSVFIFFIPTIVKVIFNLVINNNSFLECSNCLLEPKLCQNEVRLLKEEQENKKDSVEDENGIYHVNSVNNIKYVLYDQNDQRWANIGSIKTNGCHIISASVVASAYDGNITPKEVHAKYTNSYPYVVINDFAKGKFNCYHISAYNSKDTIISHLKKGNPVVIMVHGKEKGGTNPFTPSQHYMALIDYNNGQIFVGNSFSTSFYGQTGWFDENDVLSSVKEVNICEVN